MKVSKQSCATRTIRSPWDPYINNAIGCALLNIHLRSANIYEDMWLFRVTLSKQLLEHVTDILEHMGVNYLNG